MEIWVIRHGQTLDNFTRILAGHQPGQLSKIGVIQAQKTGKALQQEFFNGAYVSDLERTKKTFENIFISLKRCKNMKVFFESLLREKSGGDLEGQSIDVPRKLAQEANIDIRLFRPQNGECWNDVYERARSFLSILIGRHVKKNLHVEKLGKGYISMKEEKAKIEEKTKIIEDKSKIIEENPKSAEENMKLISEKSKTIEEKPKELKKKTKENNNEEEEEKLSMNSEKNHKIMNLLLEGKNFKNNEEGVKRKLSDSSHKNPVNNKELKKKSSLIEEKIKEDDKNTKKFLVVSHGGFIMELFNVINFLMCKEKPLYKNSSQNCSINIINIYCKNTKGRCNEKCLDNNECVQITVLKRNDIKHLI